MQFLAMAAAAALASTNPAKCDGPLQGSWLLTWQKVGDKEFTTYSGLISETQSAKEASTDLIFFVTTSHSGVGRYVMNVWQDCTQSLDQGVLNLACQVAKAQGSYGADRIRITCGKAGLATAALLGRDGRPVVDNIKLRQVAPHAPPPLRGDVKIRTDSDLPGALPEVEILE
jgi:hypothetical protein